MGTVRTAVRVEGVVQGVGFRPFVHALATGLGLTVRIDNLSAINLYRRQGFEPWLVLTNWSRAPRQSASQQSSAMGRCASKPQTAGPSSLSTARSRMDCSITRLASSAVS